MKEFSKQSNCFVRQGTKVGSTKEHNQHILIPQRVSQQSVHSSPSRVIKSQGSWVSSSRSQHLPSSIHILNKHPRQSWSKDCSPAAYQILKGITSPAVQNFPKRVQSSSPGSWSPSPQAVSLSPVDSGSLSPQSTNASPGFIQRVISLTGYNWVILSQKPRKEHRRQNLPIPSEVHSYFQYSKVSSASHPQQFSKIIYPQSISAQHGR